MIRTLSPCRASTRIGVAAVLLGSFFGMAARAADLTFTAGPATAPGPSNEVVTIEQTDVPVNVPPSAPPGMHRDAIRFALLSAGFTVSTDGPAGSSCTVQGLPDSAVGTLRTGTTGTPSDKLQAPGVGSGAVTFTGTFQPFGYNAQPAIFTAGIVTDVGELTAQVTAQELNFQTDGPIICQALFQRLAPHAPPYGAQINCAGDRLEVYFDPAYTVTQGGVIFGTTSPSPGCAGTLTLPPPGPAATLTVDQATNPVPGSAGLTISPELYPLTIGPFMSSGAKRDTIAAALRAEGLPVFDGPGGNSLTIRELSASDSVTFSAGDTGEASDMLVGAAVRGGTITFTNPFDPLAYGGQPAIFTAGIVTDVGELTAQVTAQELNFQTDGPIICQALFQRLVPHAPPYGAEINYAGDRLEVYFDPAYTVTQGGVIFGTTSPSTGSSGTITFSQCGGVNECSGNGTCAGPNQCECFAGWSGIDCSIPSCSGVNECSGNGTCAGPDQCECFAGWSGIDCSIPSCSGVNECSGNGTCAGPDQCECFAGWSGIDCSIPSCSGVNECSGNGICAGSNQCNCFAGWSGIDCSIPAAAPAGRVPAALPDVPLLLGKVGGDLSLQWGASCLGSDTDYEVYEGTIGVFYDHAWRLCSTGGFPAVTLTPGPDSHYYLVVPHNGSREGSYGLDSLSGERPPGAPACRAQLLGSCPP